RQAERLYVSRIRESDAKAESTSGNRNNVSRLRFLHGGWLSNKKAGTMANENNRNQGPQGSAQHDKKQDQQNIGQQSGQQQKQGSQQGSQGGQQGSPSD